MGNVCEPETPDMVLCARAINPDPVSSSLLAAVWSMGMHSSIGRVKYVVHTMDIHSIGRGYEGDNTIYYIV
jgi:hypothetical protein